MTSFFKVFLLSLSLLFTACTHSKFNKELNNLNLPARYNNLKTNLKVDDNWLYDFKDERLITITNQALNKNYNLKKMDFDIKIKEKELISTSSVLFPSIDASLNHSKSGDIESSSTNTTSIQLNLDYEIDLWKKLSQKQKKANIDILETKALYKESKQELVASVASSYYDLIEATKLIDIYKKNLKNAKDFLSLTKSRYEQGLSSALDVYSAKDSLYSQEIKLSQTNTMKKQTQYILEQYLAKYPKGLIQTNKKLPILDSKVNIGIPSELILRKPTITAAWNALLSKDINLAITHKERFPSLKLSASLKDQFQSSIPIAWSLLGGLSAPIFNAGALKENEELAKYELQKAELDYLDKVYSSFVEIESLSVEEINLKEEYLINIKTNENAKKSLDLSFSQYSKGLVEYITVLNSQKTYYSSQVALIKIKVQMLKNRINLHKALGGDFLKSSDTKKGI